MKIEEIVVTVPPIASLPTLKLAAKRYSPNISTETSNGLTLLLMHGLGQHKEQWEPILKRLWECSPPGQIKEAWAFDWQSHGESAVLNRKFLAGNPDVVFAASSWGAGIASFLREGRLDGHRIVPVAFSVGSIAILNTLREFTPSELPLAGIIFVEPVLFDKETSELTPETLPLAEVMRKAVNSRKSFWPDRSSARDYFSKRPPWSSWHPDILNTYLTHGLVATKDDAGNDGLTAKCDKRQEGSAFLNYVDTWNAIGKLPEMCRACQVHVVFAEDDKLTPKAWKDGIVDIKKGRTVASVVRIPGASHMVPQEKPYELAAVIITMLKSIDGGSHIISKL